MLAFGAAWAVAPVGEEALFQTLYFVSLGIVVVDLAFGLGPSDAAESGGIPGPIEPPLVVGHIR